MEWSGEELCYPGQQCSRGGEAELRGRNVAMMGVSPKHQAEAAGQPGEAGT